jgi:hypothetical protein
VLPVTFCATILGELTTESANEPWVRGASALCHIYAATDEPRFELMVSGLGRGGNGSALADGARWLPARWQVSQLSPRPARPLPARMSLSGPTARHATPV